MGELAEAVEVGLYENTEGFVGAVEIRRSDDELVVTGRRERKGLHPVSSLLWLAIMGLVIAAIVLRGHDEYESILGAGGLVVFIAAFLVRDPTSPGEVRYPIEQVRLVQTDPWIAEPNRGAVLRPDPLRFAFEAADGLGNVARFDFHCGGPTAVAAFLDMLAPDEKAEW